VIVLSGVLTVVALALLVLAGLQEDYRYVYAAIAATLVGAGLLGALVTLAGLLVPGVRSIEENDVPRAIAGGDAEPALG